MGQSSVFDSPTFERDSSIHLNTVSVGSASISPSGRDVLLASSRGLHIVDLDKPYNTPRYIQYYTPLDVADVQWSPFAARDYWVVSTAGPKALVWNLGLPGRVPIQHTLHAHTRNICDINFSAYDPDVLATCALDTNILSWDLRTPSYPVQTFSDWSEGAKQVKWNRADPNYLATSHSTRVRVWDKRKGAVPICTVENAHKGSISGVDWSRTDSARLVTCGFDSTIRFWNCLHPENGPERVIKTTFPLRRARYAPFGNAVIAMPIYGTELHLFDIRNAEKVQSSVSPEEQGGGFANVHNVSNPEIKVSQASYVFPGHKGQVKEFLWRYRGDFEGSRDMREFQLISWGTDKELCLHAMNSEACKAVGFRRGMAVYVAPRLTRRGAVYRSFREVPAHRDRTHDSLAAQAMTLTSSGTRYTFGKGYQRRHAEDSGLDNSNSHTIDWMRGVRIGEREGSVIAALALGTKMPHTHSLLDPGGALAEEIISVTDKYKSVSFEEVDIGARRVVISLKLPWAKAEESASAKTTIAFPVDYPHRSPVLKLKEWTNISEVQIVRLVDELKSIGAYMANSGRICLEALVRCLLGEWDAGTRRRLVGDVEKEIYAQSESSSDDEDMAQYLQMSVTGLLEGLNTNANVPLPKACGAVWSRDGRLVCFFPPKPRPEPRSLLQDLIERKEPRRSRDRIFEGFGRLHAGFSLLGAEKALVDSDNIDASSDDSFSIVGTSTGDSDSGDLRDSSEVLYPSAHLGSAPQDGSSRAWKHESVHDFTAMDMPRAAASLSTAQYVTIKDDLLQYQPAKRVLGDQYLVHGEPLTLCKHNAGVCKKLDYLDRAHVWNLCQLLLSKTVPLEVLSDESRNTEIYVVARRTAVHIKRANRAEKVIYDSPKAVTDPVATARVQWGSHPLGGAWLVPKIFEHYRMHGDTQMLAMLSCVMHVAVTSSSLSTGSQAAVPAASPKYYPTTEIAHSILDGPKRNLSKDAAHCAIYDSDQPQNKPTAQFTWRLKNQERFGGSVGDGFAENPLLGAEQHARTLGYREAYINQLRIWGLDKKASEILKFKEQSKTLMM